MLFLHCLHHSAARKTAAAYPAVALLLVTAATTGCSSVQDAAVHLHLESFHHSVAQIGNDPLARVPLPQETRRRPRAHVLAAPQNASAHQPTHRSL